MKKKKLFNNIVLGLSLLFVIGVTTANAIDGFMGFVSITIPNWRGQVSGSKNVRKTTSSKQYYENIGTFNSVTKAKESIMVAVKCETENECHNLNSVWMTIAFGDLSELKYDNHITLDTYTGEYSIHFKKALWGPTTSTHSGSWYLDDNMMP